MLIQDVGGEQVENPGCDEAATAGKEGLQGLAGHRFSFRDRFRYMEQLEADFGIAYNRRTTV
jgi:hypothetical protein